MIIRRERPTDYSAVNRIIKNAFKTAAESDGNEHNLAAALRKSPSFIPELTLVAEINEEIAGHIMFTKLQIGNHTALALAPLSVLPKYQNQGIGTALILEGHRIAKELGYSYSVVLGSEKYYPRMGYLPAESFNIQPPFEVPSKNFMAFKLSKDAPAISGTVKYAEEFGID